MRNFALNTHCIEALDYIVAPSSQLINHYRYVRLRPSKCLYRGYLDRQIGCYAHSCKFGYILAQSSKFFGAAVQANVSASQTGHKICFRKTIEQYNRGIRSEEHTSELQSRQYLVC